MLAYAAFFFAVFVTAVIVFLQVQTQELTRAENAYAQEIAYGFADSVHTAFELDLVLWRVWACPGTYSASGTCCL